jgi:hypothetical protein
MLLLLLLLLLLMMMMMMMMMMMKQNSTQWGPLQLRRPDPKYHVIHQTKQKYADMYHQATPIHCKHCNPMLAGLHAGPIAAGPVDISRGSQTIAYGLQLAGGAATYGQAADSLSAQLNAFSSQPQPPVGTQSLPMID